MGAHLEIDARAVMEGAEVEWYYAADNATRGYGPSLNALYDCNHQREAVLISGGREKLDAETALLRSQGQAVLAVREAMQKVLEAAEVEVKARWLAEHPEWEGVHAAAEAVRTELLTANKAWQEHQNAQKAEGIACAQDLMQSIETAACARFATYENVPEVPRDVGKLRWSRGGYADWPGRGGRVSLQARRSRYGGWHILATFAVLKPGETYGGAVTIQCNRDEKGAVFAHREDAVRATLAAVVAAGWCRWDCEPATPDCNPATSGG